MEEDDLGTNLYRLVRELDVLAVIAREMRQSELLTIVTWAADVVRHVIDTEGPDWEG